MNRLEISRESEEKSLAILFGGREKVGENNY
jgi:hypothetical protein